MEIDPMGRTRKFRPDEQVICVDATNCITLRQGKKYIVSEVVANKITTTENPGIPYLASRFQRASVRQSLHKHPFEGTTAALSFVDDVTHEVSSDLYKRKEDIIWPYVTVKFNGNPTCYTYSNSHPGINVGDYVIVPDRRTNFEYAIVKVERVSKRSNYNWGPHTRIIDVVDDQAFIADQERMKQISKLKNDLARISHNKQRIVNILLKDSQRIDHLLSQDEQGRALMKEQEQTMLELNALTEDW